MKEDLLIPLIGAIAVALIGGGISLALAILAKDQKTSEFRQAWIDGLRDDVSKLVAHFMVVASISKITKNLSQEKISEYVLSKENDFIEIALLINRIRLRMNKDEHKEFLKLISDTDGIGSDPERYEALIESIVVQSQAILKSEWRRVKRGEISFQILKWGSAVVFFASCAFGISFYLGHFEIIRLNTN
ncbi:hypothetical protein [Pseudomonas moraviensis]|uniref:hypothetical protein n=1 Tax=Pseudomonas moraviensis TaxID=321662 RepID=UPI00087969AA|nr:hypothetical protein [Pseudomonas moraviensis]SDU01334.1 hypothetical protein SAMN04490196_0074 [Pseudomonas moraviensis]